MSINTEATDRLTRLKQNIDQFSRDRDWENSIRPKISPWPSPLKQLSSWKSSNGSIVMTGYLAFPKKNVKRLNMKLQMFLFTCFVFTQ